MPLTADAINAQIIGAHKGISGGTSFEHDDMLVCGDERRERKVY